MQVDYQMPGPGKLVTRIALALLFLVLIGGITLVSVVAAQSQPANLLQQFQLHIREDAELVADQVFGVDQRPELWQGNLDLSTSNFIADLFFDNEQLADQVFGQSTRPDDWIGVTTTDQELIARNLRHDLELTASQVFGGRSRPEGWHGARAVYQCDRTLQNLLRMLDRFYNVRATTLDAVLDYCTVVEQEIEDELFATIDRQASEAEVPELISGVRGDLERLADELLGLNTRPPNWVGNRDATTATFTSELYIDLEALADNQLGVQTRPEGWIRRVATSPAVANQNLRYNLEVLADITLGAGVRPTGWQGVDPLARCDVNLQNLLLILQQQYFYALINLPTYTGDTAAYCKQVALLANDQSENPPPPPPEVVEAQSEDAVDLRYRAESRLAFSYLDVSALQYMGVMPYDTEFRAWYRNFNESNMMFVSGADFALFIDRRFTTMEEEVFRTLPTLEGRKPLTFCDASWCNGPGPTPTPTGSGPIIALFNVSTPVATVSSQQLEETGKRLVSWNNIRVSYLLDRPETRTVQVTLEICSDTQQIACEPVIQVFDNNTGTYKPVIQQFNGLNVYEFPYGYSTNVIIEGASLFSRDVWISDPAIRS